ncbi:GH3 auxin-responsive promoter family protein [uncultured Porphyromonas sp.]|uniref:GH3 auxin-responsive promoter family protein n=1 Tax=uncultured Porphyromonas sp. TaxID=159274 RepID=UPI0026388363|nr:GH3 auxin-responsive promoter family protein [uncultured Porphyromonas sp.]
MDLKTSLVYQLAKLRLRRIEEYSSRLEDLQQEQLRHILTRAARTDFGRRHGLSRSSSYSSYKEAVPIIDYEGAKADIERMVQGERDVLIPGACRWFAKSSGTTSDRSKYIPVPYLHLQDCHYRGGSDALWLYLRNYPDSRFFSTKGLVLGGSHSPMPLSGGKAQTGDLSSILVEHMPLLGNLLRVPSRETLLMSEWTAKMKAIVEEVKGARVGSLSGVPSWMLVLLKEVLSATGRDNISEVWPDLEVFFHGGISFSPYRSTYAELIPSERMRYEETYNASEGFFAIQDDPAESGMLLMLDYGVFYEFIPMDEFPSSSSDYSSVRARRIHEVELGRDYALVISTLGGLYRYILGDTVRFTSLYPHRIVITGRTKHFINAFGEEVMVANADGALAEACRRDGKARVSEYTAAPCFFLDEGKGRHDWLIEFETEPRDLATFSRDLDDALRQLNSDYDAKRYEDMTLLPLSVEVAPSGLFHRWLEAEGKLGGQHKVPRLANSRHYLDALLRLRDGAPDPLLHP